MVFQKHFSIIFQLYLASQFFVCDGNHATLRNLITCLKVIYTHLKLRKVSNTFWRGIRFVKSII